MPISGKNGKVTVELGQTARLGQQLNDSGDHINYTTATGHAFSRWVSDPTGAAESLAPVIKPNGIKPGGGGVVSVPASGSNDVVDISAITDCYIDNNEITLAAQTDLAVTRPAANDYQKISVCVDYNAGTPQAVVVEGTENTAFSDTRGAAGGPPLIPLDHVELAQVWYTSQVAAPIVASEIKALPNQHREHSDFPAPTTDDVNGTIAFVSALEVSHTGSVTKNVYADTYEPNYSKIQFARGFTPTVSGIASTSNTTYDGVVNATTDTLTDGSFEVLIEGTPSESIFVVKGQSAHYKFYPDKNKNHFIRGIADFGVQDTYPEDNNATAAVTMVAASKEVRGTD